MTTLMSNDQAAEAIRAHHLELAAGLRQRVAGLLAAVREQRPHAEAHARVLEHLEGEVLPHARAEEQALYPVADTGATAMLVRAMRDEHRDLTGRVEGLHGERDPVGAAASASAILALFDSHLHKENDLLIPVLAEAPGVSLASLLAGMHELLG